MTKKKRENYDNNNDVFQLKVNVAVFVDDQAFFFLHTSSTIFSD